MGAKRHPLVGNMAGARHGTTGSESSTSAVSTPAAVAPLTCGFLHPAQLGWSGGHFPLEGEGVTLAVCGGRGGRGGRVAALLPQPATKKRKGCLVWLPLPLGLRAPREQGHTDGSVHWYWGTGVCSGQAVSLLAAGAGGKFCQIWIRIELLSNNFPMEEEK